MADASTSAETLIICELLCYLQNNFARSTANGLLTAISGFYSMEEITNAKHKLYEVIKRAFTSCDDLDINNLPRFTTRRPGDNKRRLDAGDVVELYTTLDTMVTNNDSPRFVALDLSRIPPFMPDATDFCSLAAGVEFLHGQMADVLKRLSSYPAVPGVNMLASGTVCNEVKLKAVQSTSLAGAHAGSNVTHVIGSSTTDQGTRSGAGSYANSIYVQPAIRQPQPPRSCPTRVYGSKKVNSVAVKAVPRRLMAFVGRLHTDTTVDDLTSFLTESGLRDVRCTKLKTPPGREFKTAAFCVSCPSVGNEDIFYMDSVWPECAEVRDWYFKAKPSTNEHNSCEHDLTSNQ
jgi:hypothetical protein